MPPAVVAQAGGFEVMARFSLQRHEGDAAEQVAGRLYWVHGGGRDTMVFSDPFGRGLASLDMDARGASLRLADGRVLTDTDADALMLQAVGYPLPVRRLVAWVLPPANAQRDEVGRASRYQESGWHVEYTYAEAAARRPDRLRLTHPGRDGVGQIEVRLRIEEWNE